MKLKFEIEGVDVVKGKQFYVGLLIGLLCALPGAAQTFKRGPKQAGKVAAAQQPQTSKAKEAESAEEQLAAAKDRITTHELKRKLDAKEDLVILDNRDGRAWIGSAVKIKGAIHITLSQLEARMKDLPQDKEIITYCT